MNFIKKIRKHILPQAIILLYHRVADVRNDPHLLAVSIKNFRVQMDWLKANTNIASLSQLIRQIKDRQVKPRQAIVTFDDGYADNYHNALPILEELGVMTTVFVTAAKVDDRTPFYWDKRTNKKDQGRPLTAKELKVLSKGSLVEIGSHGLNHVSLSSLNKSGQEKEIYESKSRIEKIIKTKVKHFSYPFGTNSDYNQETIEILKRRGFVSSCANFPGLATKKSDVYQLPRFIVRDWGIRQFKSKIKDFYFDN